MRLQSWHPALALVGVLLVLAHSAVGSTKRAKSLSVTGSLEAVFKALPRPTKALHLDPESGIREPLAATDPRGSREVRVYERQTGPGDDEETTTLEVRVTLNGDLNFPEPFGSESGEPRPFTHDGLPATRFSLAGLEDSRVAMPVTDAERANTLTVVRLFVGPAAAHEYLTATAEGRRPERSPWDGKTAQSPAEIRTIVVEYYGPRAEVERLVRATKAAPLRALLSPTL